MKDFLAFSAARGSETCEVESCPHDASKRYPTPRRMCVAHLRVWTSPGFHGCGCGPDPCPPCARHMTCGHRILVVGERENRPGWQADDAGFASFVANLLAAPPRELGGMCGSAAVMVFLEQAGALRWGGSRQRLAGLGLRWDNAINLLGPSAIPGLWNPRLALGVARAASEAAHQKYDTIIVLGVKAAKAWETAAPKGGKARTVHLPHPSGRNRAWNDLQRTEGCRSLIDEIYSSAPAPADISPT